MPAKKKEAKKVAKPSKNVKPAPEDDSVTSAKAMRTNITQVKDIVLAIEKRANKCDKAGDDKGFKRQLELAHMLEEVVAAHYAE